MFFFKSHDFNKSLIKENSYDVVYFLIFLLLNFSSTKNTIFPEGLLVEFENFNLIVIELKQFY